MIVLGELGALARLRRGDWNGFAAPTVGRRPAEPAALAVASELTTAAASKLTTAAEVGGYRPPHPPTESARCSAAYRARMPRPNESES